MGVIYEKIKKLYKYLICDVEKTDWRTDIQADRQTETDLPLMTFTYAHPVADPGGRGGVYRVEAIPSSSSRAHEKWQVQVKKKMATGIERY